jgi:hypothetical protein
LVFKMKMSTQMNDADWERRGFQPLGEAGGNLYFLLSPGADFPKEFVTELRAYAAGPDEEGGKAPLHSFFNKLDGISPYDRDDRRGRGIPEDLSFDGPILVDVVVWPAENNDEAARRIGQVRSVLAAGQAELVAADERAESPVVRARVSGSTLDALLDMAVVERIWLTPIPYIEPSDWADVRIDGLAQDFRSGEPIGIIDDEIGDHPLLRQIIAARLNFPDDAVWGRGSSHGTMVAGLAAYGAFEPALAAGDSLIGVGPIYGARLFGPDPQDTTQPLFAVSLVLHEAIERAIRTLNSDHGVRLFNLSLNVAYEYDGTRVDPLTERLDRLSSELGVLIVVSTGNQQVSLDGTTEGGFHVEADYPEFLVGPESRVAEPAPGALVVTVGAIARSAAPTTPDGAQLPGAQAIAAEDEISPMTRSGPGGANCVKPDFVAYGGNWYFNQSTNQVDQNNVALGVVSTDVNGDGRLFRAASGTSFAAPQVTRVLADTWTRYPRASSNLVRCLVALSARLPEAALSQFPTNSGATVEARRRRLYGLGIPDSARAADSDARRVIMTYEGSIDPETVVIHPIPIPGAFAAGSGSRRVRVALAFDPLVRRTRQDYIAGRIKMDLVRDRPSADIVQIYGAQDHERIPLPSGTERPSLRPSTTTFKTSTLHLCEWKAARDFSNHADTWHLVLAHTKAAWAGDEPQRYALAVELLDEAHEEIDLYGLVEQRVRPRVRVRPRG